MLLALASLVCACQGSDAVTTGSSGEAVSSQTAFTQDSAPVADRPASAGSPAAEATQDTAALSSSGRGESSDTAVGASEGPKPSEIAAASAEDAAARKLASMSLEEKVAQMFIVYAESLCSDGSTLLYVDDDVQANLEKYPVGGVSIMGANLADPEQAAQLASGLQDVSRDRIGLDLLLCVDEEGGTVARIGSNDLFPEHDAGDMRAIGDTGNAQAAYDAAVLMGGYLKAYGYNADFAPVCDVDNPSGGTMYSRSFGSDYALVASMVEEQVRGFADAGVLSCAKHFPGIGAATGDSHETAITTSKTIEQMRAEDLVPFDAAIKAGVPMVMVGHISCPGITGDSMPATFSPAVVTGILRDEMGYDGVVVTDSLGMGAATAVYSDSQAAAKAIEAGCDMVLMPYDLDAAYQGVLDALAAGDISKERIDQSVLRILKMKYSFEQ